MNSSDGPSTALDPPVPPAPQGRTMGRDGAFNVIRRGGKTALSSDIYHRLLTASWPRFLGLIAALYLIANAAFAVAYALGGACIQGARPGSLVDTFFFSVQTMATIGYGSMVPVTMYAHGLVAFEALFGLLCLAMATGLMFAKFSRPTARVLFSKVALLQHRDGKRHLVLRVANERGNQIVEASMRMVALVFETTLEGERIRRFRDMKLVRAQNPVFALTWLAMHPIDEESPLHGRTDAELRAQGLEIMVMLVGIDESFAQTIHARSAYTLDDVVEDARFVDIVEITPAGERVIQLDKLDAYVKIAPPELSRALALQLATPVDP